MCDICKSMDRGGFRRSSYSEPKRPHPKFVAYCKEEYEKVMNPRYFGSKVLVVYLRDSETNEPFGVILSYKDNGGIRFGWSVCQTGLDKWDKYIGFHYAFKRSMSDIARVPRHLQFDFDEFVARSFRYFKVDPNTTPTNIGSPLPAEG